MAEKIIRHTPNRPATAEDARALTDTQLYLWSLDRVPIAHRPRLPLLGVHSETVAQMSVRAPNPGAARSSKRYRDAA